MARVKTDSGVLRDLVNEVCSTVKILQSPVMERKPESAAVFLEGLRESLLALNSAMVGIADTYRVDLSPEGFDESESETAAE